MSTGRILQILGTAPNIADLPEIAGAERWACNNPRVYRIRGNGVLKTWTRWFNLHSFEHMQKKYPTGFKWYEAQDGTRPIYFRDGAWPTVANSHEFPAVMLMEFFRVSPEEREEFFTFSGSWLMALALYEHLTGQPIERIELWGIQMRRDHQFDFERPAMHYWIGRARQAGIQVLVPKGVDLCRAPKLYGYQTVEPFRTV